MSQTPVAAPVNTDFAGQGAQSALNSVMRVVSSKTNSMGTGFLHASGRVITAEHVVRAAGPGDIILLTSKNVQVASRSVLVDAKRDLAIVEPVTPFAGLNPLQLAGSSTLTIGTTVSTWGFPGGYSGFNPMLTVGYLSGVEAINGVDRYVVNAAFNSGNSGGPVLHLESGNVIGVVASKLTPLPPQIQQMLQALAQQQNGMQWTVSVNGQTKNVSEAQIVAEILQFLRGQTQLVVGHAVILDDLKAFLSSQGLTP